MKSQTSSIENIYKLDGRIPIGKAIPFGLQHILAMFVANITPIFIVAGVSGLSTAQTINLVQCAMLIAGIGTLIQLFPLWHIGSGLPIVMGISFTFVGVFCAIGTNYGYGIIIGSVLIGGCIEGLLGLFAVQFARLSGAYPVIGADYLPDRRDLAEALGADFVLDPADPSYIEQFRGLTNGVNTAIEVTGNPNALKQTLRCSAKFARVLLLGCTRAMTEVDFYNDVHRPGIQLIGAHSGARPVEESHSGFFTEMDDCRVILSYLSAGKLDFKHMISEYHSPSEATEVYSRLAHGRFPVGVLFDWNQFE